MYIYCSCLVNRLCLTLLQPHSYSLPGSSVHGILQAVIVEQVAISFSRGSTQSRDQTHISALVGGFFTTEPPGKPLYIYLYMKYVSRSVMSYSLQSHGLQPARLLCPWDSSGKNTRVSCHSLLQGIFPVQGMNLCLPHCWQILYHMSQQGSPYMCVYIYTYTHIYVYIHV